MKKPKHFWNNPWTVSVGSGLIVLIITLLIDLVTAEQLFSTIGNVLSFIWKAVISFLNIELKLWWVLVGIAILFLILILWSKLIESSSAKQIEPEFIKYTKDTILQYRWNWVWEKDLYGKYKIENLHPICRECETPLTITYSGYGRLKCLRCGEVYTDELPEEENVKMLIADNVRRKYFPNE